MRKYLAILIGVLLLMTSSLASAQSDAPKPRLSYMVCPWGLLTIEHPVAAGASFLTITSPKNYSGVPETTFTLEGEGGGLFEGNVVVDIDADGKTMFSRPTTLESAEVGGPGTWSLEVTLDKIDAATPVTVTAHSESPEDGSTIALATIQLNVHSDTGLPFVQIVSPVGNAGVSATPLRVVGIAGAAIENNVGVQVIDIVTDQVIANTFATVITDQIGGTGPFTVDIPLDVEPGRALIVTAFLPPIEEGEDIKAQDVQSAIVSPLAQTYSKLLVIRDDDPLNATDDLCGVAAAEFDNQNIQPLTVDSVNVAATRSMTPLVNLTINATGSSKCAAPIRTRIVNDNYAFTVESYRDVSQPAACTQDLAPITLNASLGTLQTTDYTITVNGKAIP